MQIRAKTISRNGAKTVHNTSRRRLLLASSLVLMTVALMSLNAPQLLFEPLPLWYRVATQALLMIGLLRSKLTSKYVRVAGWAGICLFIPYVVFGSIPSLDHPALDINGEQRPELWMWKLALSMALSVSMIMCFRKLGVKPKSP